VLDPNSRIEIPVLILKYITLQKCFYELSGLEGGIVINVSGQATYRMKKSYREKKV
jgi:hypothetical protein